MMEYMDEMPEIAKTVLVTGASSGIGKAATLLLAGRGLRVFAGVRRVEDAEAITDERIQPVMLDITDDESIAAAACRIEAEVGEAGLDGLVNNAGLMLGGPLEFFPMDDLRRILEVNVIGQIAVTQAMMPLLRCAHGRIVNISSVSGRMALPLFGPYNASKFALEALSDALRMELAGSGVSVIVIEPGPVQSNIWNKARQHNAQLCAAMQARTAEFYGPLIEAVQRVASESEATAIPAERLAELIYHALTAPRPATRYPIGRFARTRDLAARILPDRLRDWIILRLGLHLRGEIR